MPFQIEPLSWEAAATIVAGAWAAFATLATGAAAVGGAIWIGLRQVGIATRQAEIVERQVEIQAGQLKLEEMKGRMALFDERMKVYSAAERWLIRFAQDGKKPVGDTEREFRNAIDRSRFLFGDSLRNRLFDLWTAANQHHVHMKDWEAERAAHHLDKAHVIALQLTSAMTALPAIFGPKIDLSDVA